MIIQVDPKYNHKYLNERRQKEILEVHTEKDNMILEAQVRVMWLQAKECQEPPPEAGRVKK